MNAAQATAQLRAFLQEIGEDIVIRRYSGSGPDRPKTEVTVRARVVEYASKDIIGPVQLGDRKLIVLADPLADLLPLKPAVGNDVAVVRNRELQIIRVDDNTRRIGGTLVGLEIQVRGK